MTWCVVKCGERRPIVWPGSDMATTATLALETLCYELQRAFEIHLEPGVDLEIQNLSDEEVANVW